MAAPRQADVEKLLVEHDIRATRQRVRVLDELAREPNDATAHELFARLRAHGERIGLATIYRLSDGRRVLRLTEFVTSNGPDVRVFLVAAGDAQDEVAAKQAGVVDLGALKGNIGDQNYDVPTDLDLTKYRAVSIWCRRFSVNFGAAPLVEQSS